MALDVFHPARRSFLRGNILVLVSVLLALWFSGFPDIHANPLLAIPCLLVIAGTVETARCIQRRWTWRHAAVILCLYMDLMAITLVGFLLLFPYLERLQPRR